MEDKIDRAVPKEEQPVLLADQDAEASSSHHEREGQQRKEKSLNELINDLNSFYKEIGTIS